MCSESCLGEGGDSPGGTSEGSAAKAGEALGGVQQRHYEPLEGGECALIIAFGEVVTEQYVQGLRLGKLQASCTDAIMSRLKGVSVQ